MSFEPRVVHPSDETDVGAAESIAAPRGNGTPTDHALPTNGAKRYSRAQSSDIQPLDVQSLEAAEQTANAVESLTTNLLTTDLPAELAFVGGQLQREATRLAEFYPAVRDEEEFLKKLAAARAEPDQKPWFQRFWFRSIAAGLLLAAGLSFLIPPGPLDNSATPTAFPSVRDATEASSRTPVELTPVKNTETKLEVQLLRGLSGEEIEGLRAFERPGTKVSM